jgi:hypothetical protein
MGERGEGGGGALRVFSGREAALTKWYVSSSSSARVRPAARSVAVVVAPASARTEALPPPLPPPRPPSSSLSLRTSVNVKGAARAARLPCPLSARPADASRRSEPAAASAADADGAVDGGAAGAPVSRRP